MRYDYRDYETLVVNGNDLTDIKNIKTALQEITGTVNLQEMNLKNKIIGKMDLTGAILQDANLRGVDMIETILVDANLEGVDLIDADLTRADLTNANISNADFVNMDLIDAKLNGIISENVYFNNASANDSKFIAITFDSCVFDNTNLRDTDFTDAKFTNVDFHKADLKRADMTNIECTGIVSFEKAKLIDTILVDARLSGANFDGATLTRTNFTNATLTHTYFNTSLDTAILTGADLTNIHIRTNINGINLSGVRSMRHADLRGVHLNGTNLSGVPLQGADFTGAQMQGAILTGANLTGTILIGANLEGAILTDVIGMEQAIHEAQPERQAGQAFEIHNQFQFDFDFDKFMEIIRTYNTEHAAEQTSASQASPNSRSDEAEPNLGEDLRDRQITERLLKPLIDYPGYTQKRNVLKQLNIAYEDRDEDAIQDTITFVLLQSPKFIKKYIHSFTNDCTTAYTSGRRTSCIKGQYERIFLNVKLAIKLYCLDDNSHGLKPDCKEVFKDLYACFLPEDLKSMMNEWWDAQTDMDDYPNDGTEPEKMVFINKKSAELKDFFIGEYSEKFAGAIDIYIKKTFTIAYFDSELKKPELAVQLEPQVNIKYDGEVYNFKIVPDRTTIGELKGMLLDKLVENGKNPDVNYMVRFAFSGRMYPNEKNGEIVSTVINQNYEAGLVATMKSNTGMGKTRKLKKGAQTKKLQLKKRGAKTKRRRLKKRL